MEDARERPAFPEARHPPSEAEFTARLPHATGKRFESVRAFLGKRRGVTESVYFFGPTTGWAYRYLYGGHSVATLVIHGGCPLGIVALDPQAAARVDFGALSEVARQARRAAHGSPSLSWLDVPLDGSGAADFKALVKAKLLALSAEPKAPSAAAEAGGTIAPVRAPSPRRSGPASRGQTPPPPPPPPARAPSRGSGEAGVGEAARRGPSDRRSKN